MESQFKPCRKRTPTVARILTEGDYEAFGGIIATNEGRQPFLPGDHLAKDAKGQWPISVQTVREHYERIGEVDAEGFARYRSRNVCEAMQRSKAFSVGGLVGKPGDYWVKRGGREWVVDREIFEGSYEFIEGAAEDV